MTELKQVYKCEICGNITEVVHNSVGELVCCTKPMKLLKENTVDAAKEKHIPVMERHDGGILVKIGAAAHPMLEEHHIEWIELHTQRCVYRAFLKPGEAPEAFFRTEEEPLYARGYCNLHGLWKS